MQGPLKERQPVRPPVVHRHGAGALQDGEGPVEVNVFRHPLLQVGGREPGIPSCTAPAQRRAWGGWHVPQELQQWGD